MKKKYYAYFLPDSGAHGIAESWSQCERIVRARAGARYRGFATREAAEAWLLHGADYANKYVTARPGIYFDAGTGSGQGVEISVTDEQGRNLLGRKFALTRLNSRGKHLIIRSTTNNYGELLACCHALRIALRTKILHVYGDSRLVLEYWSRGYIKRNEVDAETVKLAARVARLRRRFEKVGGAMELIAGGDNPADLGFHR